MDPQEDATAAIDLSQRPTAPVGPARVGYAGRFAQVERSGDASALAARAVDSLELPLTDTLGARTAWYALCCDGLPVAPGVPAAGLTGELTLRRVPNQVVVATVELDGGPVRVRVPVSTAVPLPLLRRSLRELLGVDGAFTVSVGGRPLPERGALAELWPEGPPSDPVLEVRR